MKLAKTFKVKTISFFMAMMLCFFGAGEFLLRVNTVSAATDATVQAMEQKIKDIQKKKKETLSMLNSIKSNQAKAKEYKGYIDQQINLTTEEIETINTLIAELDNQINEKTGQIGTASANIDNQYDNFKQIMRLTDEEGSISYIEMVLGAKDFYDFLSRVERVTSLMEYCSKLLEEYRQNKIDLETAKAGLETAKAAQVEYMGELEARQAELDTLQNENESYLKSLQSDMTSYQKTYNEYVKQESELDAQLEKYLKELQAKENSQYVGGEFRWPLPLNWKSISSPYGYRTLFGVREFHRGIDIPASKNTYIYASNGGKVVTATFHNSYGNYVVIDHGGGKSTLYAHANKLNCKVGDIVKQGDVIAYVGTTGHSTGNHLHFEVRISGSAKNPLDYVARPK